MNSTCDFKKAIEDDEMRFDDGLNMFILTPKAFLNRGVDLISSASNEKGVSPDTIVNEWLYNVSLAVYGYIHDFSAYNEEQDRAIYHLYRARTIVKQALIAQGLYMRKVGDLSLARDKDMQERAVAERVKQILQQTIPELGHSLIYAGRWGMGWF